METNIVLDIRREFISRPNWLGNQKTTKLTVRCGETRISEIFIEGFFVAKIILGNHEYFIEPISKMFVLNGFSVFTKDQTQIGTIKVSGWSWGDFAKVNLKNINYSFKEVKKPFFRNLFSSSKNIQTLLHNDEICILYEIDYRNNNNKNGDDRQMILKKLPKSFKVNSDNLLD